MVPTLGDVILKFLHTENGQKLCKHWDMLFMFSCGSIIINSEKVKQIVALKIGKIITRVYVCMYVGK